MNSRKTFHLALFLSLLSTFTFCFAQNGGPNQLYLERSFKHDDSFSLQNNEIDSLITWQERIMLHVDRSIIKEDTPLFFKAFTLTGPNRVRATLSKVLKVELMNDQDQIITVQYYKIENGISSGAITIPKKLEDGNYTLQAYTRWMQNYGKPYYATKKLQLGSSVVKTVGGKVLNAASAVSFHPEGGELVAGLSNRLLIKIPTGIGESDGRYGVIMDSKTKKVAVARPYGPQIMSAIFTPEPHERYTLKTNQGISYPLPAALSSGYVLNVNNLDPTSLRIRIQATSEFKNTKFWLKGEMSGVTYIDKELHLEASAIAVNVPKEGIPFGVLTLTIGDIYGRLLAKRPVLIDSKKDLTLSISQLEQSSNKDELAFKIKVTDAEGKPVATEVSLSATHVENVPLSLNSPERNAFIWETDELDLNIGQTGRIERYVNDLELLTSVDAENDMISHSIPDRINYPFQQGLNLYGYAYNLNNELLKNTKIQMIGASETDAIAEEIKTDAFGRIRIENLQFVGETKLIFRTVGNDVSSRLVKIIPLQEDFEPESTATPKLDFSPYKKGKIVNTSPWKPIDQEKVVALDEVEVVQRKFKEKKTQPSVYGLEPTRVKFQDVKRPQSIPQLFLGIPGVRVIGLGGLRPQVILPKAATLGPGPALWVLDGIPLTNPPPPITPLSELMGSISYIDVERIEILYGAEASIYGSRAAGGAIAIYTRSGAGLDYVNRKEGQLNFQGYYASPTFDSYLEAMNRKPNKYKKGVNTLFWNPNIKTNERGEAVVRFKVPFEYRKLELKASTVTEVGGIGSTKVVIHK
jgi:hypothetical protein